MLTEFAIKNYRSIEEIWLRLEQVTVLVGQNACGKSNLYRSLELLASAATGDLAFNISEEGGIKSIRFSSEKTRQTEDRLKLSIRTESHQYDLVLDAPSTKQIASHPWFKDDIEIKLESVRLLRGKQDKVIFKREKGSCNARDCFGNRRDYTKAVRANQSVLNEVKDPDLYPELSKLSQALKSWRFFHRFRTDRDSPLREPCFPIATPCIASDGSNLTSAIATILEQGDEEGFLQSFEEAFPDANLIVKRDIGGLKLQIKYKYINRPMEASELSEGTLKYLCLLACLYANNPPPFMAINEPETSIHEDLIEPLARLIIKASEVSQIWITTHSQLLADYILEYGGYSEIQLEKVDGATRAVGLAPGKYRYHDEEKLDEEDLDLAH